MKLLERRRELQSHEVQVLPPLGRIGQPRDIAGTAVFLASADSS